MKIRSIHNTGPAYPYGHLRVLTRSLDTKPIVGRRSYPGIGAISQTDINGLLHLMKSLSGLEGFRLSRSGAAIYAGIRR